MTATVRVGAIVWLLALAAAVPGLSLLVLGYLLVVEGRVARGQKLSEAFPMFDLAPRAAVAVVIAWLAFLPARLLWGAALDARVIDPAGAATNLLFGLSVATALFALLHVFAALLRGGKWRALLWPPSNVRWALGRTPAERPRTRWRELEPLRLLELGLKGFVGALIWLGAPALLWLAARAGEHPPLAVLGGLLLVSVLFSLPFLQVHFAATGRWGALFEWRVVGAHFRRAPLAFFAALVVTYLLTLPLYLLKVVLPPRDAAWLVTLFFVGTVLPVRLLLAGAWRRAGRKAEPAPGWLIWPARLALVPVLGAYSVMLFLAPLVDSHGKWVLLTHHAFLVPSPF